MITVTADNNDSHILKSTIFPDGTSQVWKLPDAILRCSSVSIDWRFESEREIIDLLSLNKLLKNQLRTLHVPYLPYARQDKDVANNTTFNLEVFADLINSMGLTRVTSVDAHNPRKTEELIGHFRNIEARGFQEEVINLSKPDFLVFPDAGAYNRYELGELKLPIVICDKDRDQLTGNIVGHKIVHIDTLVSTKLNRFLIVDDLCDGGATFISVAKLIRECLSCEGIDLCVTHGVFSRGREHLLTNGINRLYTTNSLIKNEDGYHV